MTRMLLRTALGASALAVLLAGCGGATTSTPAAPASSSSSSSAAASSTTAPAPSTSGAPAAASSTTSTGATSAAPVAITIKDFMFMVPASVKAGATITITNSDNEAHTVTSKDGGFDVKVAGRGGTAQLTAPSKPGSYALTCDFHANMSGSLVVS